MNTFRISCIPHFCLSFLKHYHTNHLRPWITGQLLPPSGTNMPSNTGRLFIATIQLVKANCFFVTITSHLQFVCRAPTVREYSAAVSRHPEQRCHVSAGTAQTRSNLHGPKLDLFEKSTFFTDSKRGAVIARRRGRRRVE